MNDLLSAIYAKLTSALSTTAETIQVYLEEAPQGTQYPYATFELTGSLDQWQREDFMMTVDLWDKAPDTTKLDELFGRIDKVHRWQYRGSTQDLWFSAYRESRAMIPMEDVTIRRREVRFSVQAYLEDSLI